MQALELDTIDQQILDERIKDRVARFPGGPQVGDFVDFPSQDRPRERVAHDWGEDGVQTSPGGSIYLAKDYASYSGSLNPTIRKEHLQYTGETISGTFWFFSHDYHTANNGIIVEAPCRLYTYYDSSNAKHDHHVGDDGWSIV